MAALVRTAGPYYTGRHVLAGIETGYGYVIGTNLVLTAGHVVFEWNRNYPTDPLPSGTTFAVSSSDIETNPNVTVRWDDRGYKSAYVGAAQTAYDNRMSTAIPENAIIEGGIASQDIVAVSQTGAAVSASSAGLAEFLDPAKLVTLSSSLPGATLKRVAHNTVTNGTVTSVDAALGTFQYSQLAQVGDSGGAYILTYLGKQFVLGVQSSDQGQFQKDANGKIIYKNGVPQPLTPSSAWALGELLRPSEFGSLTTLAVQGKTGDFIAKEPVNLIVGSDNGDTIQGTARRDLIIGGAGNDNISASSGDEVNGGGGNDKIILSPTTGQPEGITVDFTAKGGHDVVETKPGVKGNYILDMTTLNPADVSIIAGGEDLYHGYGSVKTGNSYNGVAFEFLSFKINATGDTITFVGSDRQVGSAANPDFSKTGTDYQKLNGPISSVKFAGNVTWSAAQLWDYISNYKTNSNVSFDLAYRPYSASSPAAVNPPYSETALADYAAHINSLYFQADPFPTGTSAPVMRAAVAQTTPPSTSSSASSMPSLAAQANTLVTALASYNSVSSSDLSSRLSSTTEATAFLFQNETISRERRLMSWA